MSHGKGSISIRKIDSTLKRNGFKLDRENGHRIYKNNLGDTIIIPRSCHNYLIQRVFKENNIQWR